ncbi:MAG TPA: MarR family transcriptional regulator [Streptosporangiaceae bacterium]|nr:MarR family transcriptional regulator [Streptosporangiaceae bacterium]
MSVTEPGPDRRDAASAVAAAPVCAEPASGATGGTASAPSAEPVVSAWRSLAASHAAACAALEHELGQQHGLGVSEFEVLDRLAERPERNFRAQELAGAVHLSQSALSRLIDRLEKHGLVERCLCGEDRRGIYVALTAAGQQRHAEAAPTHRRVLAAVLPAGSPVA